MVTDNGSNCKFSQTPPSQVPPFKENTKVFPTVCDLVEYYKQNYLPLPEPNNKVTLGNPCKRPKWILKRHNLEVEANQLLGSGNFCDVYKGKFNKRRAVAIKICHTAAHDDKKSEEQIDREFLARDALIKEGQLMSQIRHFNVITVRVLSSDP